MVKGGEAVVLDPSEQALLAEAMRRLVQSCSLNSVDHPRALSSPSPASQWTLIESQSHLHARFETPFETQSMSGPPRVVSEVLVGFEHPNLIGPELTRHEEAIVAYVKCDGGLAIKLMCAAPLAPYLSASQKGTCERLTSWLRDSEELGADDIALRAIAAGKAITAWSLDASLPPEPVETWLRRLIPADATIRWEANDCGEGGDAPDRIDGPICAELRGEWTPDFVVSFLFAVGTERKGISGNPTLFWAYIQEGGTLQELTSLRDARERLRGVSPP